MVLSLLGLLKQPRAASCVCTRLAWTQQVLYAVSDSPQFISSWHKSALSWILAQNSGPSLEGMQCPGESIWAWTPSTKYF